MFPKSIFTITFLVVVHLSFAQSFPKRKTDWTVSEVKEWVEKYKDASTWHGWLLYRGSDTTKHYFISRWMDEFVWFNIKRSELLLKEERRYQTTSSAPFGYYYVDAAKDFVKIKDY